MPDQSMINGAIAGATGLFTTIIALFGFTNKFQTKASCVLAHSEHDKLEAERQKTRDIKLETMFDCIGRVEEKVNEIHKDFYGPRLSNTRRND